MLNVNVIKNLCQKYRLVPSKKFGQNYLLSAEPIEKMLAALALKSTETVVEVGPGFGVLTLPLAARVKQVVSFEIERKLAPYWEEKIKIHKNIEIIWGDFLKNQDKLPQGKYKVAANLPYQITARILRAFLTAVNPPQAMVCLVQKEVGERIVSASGKMSPLAVSVQYYAEPAIIATVFRNDFYPVPRVDSAILFLRMKPRPKENFSDEQFFRLVKAGFSHPRKLLLNNLTILAPREVWTKIFIDLELGLKIRAEDLIMEKWRELARLSPII